MTVRRVLSIVFGFAAAGALASAEGNPGYDPGRPCRSYVVRHLPVPTRCLAELQGGWSARPYIDDGFAFHDHDEYLRWRDREDYRHWRAHDYAFPEAGTAAEVPPPPPPAAAPPPATSPRVTRTILCPAQIRMKLVPLDRENLAQSGWPAGESEVMLRLDSSNPPHSSGAILSCYYALGGQRGIYLISRPVGEGQCLPNSEGTGFSCTP